jgi:purine-binding chemotaxis protein CheW
MSSEPLLQSKQHLTLLVADEEYAIEILRVREIIELTPVTKVPSTPAAIRGVINLRGAVVPVIHLAIKLGVGARPITKKTCIVIVEIDVDGARTSMGLLVDAVRRVLDLEGSRVEPVPPFGTHVNVEFLKGMAAAGEKFLLVLDLANVLSIQELRAATELGSLPPGALRESRL